jgi:anti-sigma factor RsiW
MQDRYFTDEELVAFLDGEDDLAPAAEIALALKSDEALVLRVEALSLDKQAIANSFARLLPASNVIPDLSVEPREHFGFSLRSLAMVACIVLMIGIGTGAWLTVQSRSGWTSYVAAYQALYSSGTLAHINQDTASKQAQLDRVAASIGKSSQAEMLEGFPEAEYRRAQILSFEGQALLQLAFTTSSGEPLALCIIRSGEEVEAGPKLDHMEGLSMAWWSSAGYEYLLIGGQDDALVSRIASEFVSMKL